MAEKMEIAQKLSNSVIDNTKYKNELTKLFKANEDLEKDNVTSCHSLLILFRKSLRTIERAAQRWLQS